MTQQQGQKICFVGAPAAQVTTSTACCFGSFAGGDGIVVVVVKQKRELLLLCMFLFPATNDKSLRRRAYVSARSASMFNATAAAHLFKVRSTYHATAAARFRMSRQAGHHFPPTFWQSFGSCCMHNDVLSKPRIVRMHATVNHPVCLLSFFKCNQSIGSVHLPEAALTCVNAAS